MKDKYNIRELTPKEMSCGITMVCPAIYDTNDGDYLIVGKKVSPEEFGLEKKVGEDETLVRVSTKLIDDKGK